MMRAETAQVIWWAAGWGGLIDPEMLAVARGCSVRGARDVLATAARHHWLRPCFLSPRKALYQVTEAGRAMAAFVGFEIPQTPGFSLQEQDGILIPPKLWPHARAASIAAARILKNRYSTPFREGEIIPMDCIPPQRGKKRPDAFIRDIIEEDEGCWHPLEYERTSKRGRKPEHRNWATLCNFIADVSAGEVAIEAGRATSVIVVADKDVAVETSRVLHKQLNEIAEQRRQKIDWHWGVDFGDRLLTPFHRRAPEAGSELKKYASLIEYYLASRARH